MEQLTVKEFETRLKNAGEIEVFKDLRFTFDFTVNGDNCKSKRLNFEKCEFLKTFKIKDIGLELGIAFTECTFNENLIIQRVEINDNFIDPRIDYRSISLLVENCKISKSLAINAVQILRDFTIIETTIYELIISGLVSKEGGLNIKNSTVEYYVKLEQCVLANSIRFITVTCKDSLRFTNNSALSYYFEKNTFDSDSWIWYGKLKEGITVSGGNYKDAFIVESVDAKGGFSISDAKFESYVSVAYESKNGNDILRHGCPKIYLRDSQFNHGLYISGKRFSVNNFAIEGIDIRLSKKLQGEINIGGLEIGELKITGTNYDANLIFNDNLLGRLTLERVTNFGTIHLLNTSATSNTKKLNEINSINSYLGKFYFTNVSFDGFKKISIEDSNFSAVIASNVKWFKLNQLEKPNELKHLNHIQQITRGFKHLVKNVSLYDPELNHYRRKRELFRQLKFAMHQQGNTIQSLVFKQYEMIFFTRELRLSKRFFNKDRLIMEFSCTNSHGQNWIKPILILTLLVTPFFGFLLLLVKNYGYSDFHSMLCNNKSIFIYLLNPTFSLKDVFGDQRFSGYLMAVSITYRVFYAFFVFQIISAFRKYIK